MSKLMEFPFAEGSIPDGIYTLVWKGEGHPDNEHIFIPKGSRQLSEVEELRRMYEAPE